MTVAGISEEERLLALDRFAEDIAMRVLQTALWPKNWNPLMHATQLSTSEERP